MMMPLRPKMIGANSMMRINWAVSTCCSGAKPGAIRVLTSGKANTAATIANTVVTISKRLLTLLASRQAARCRGSSSRVSVAEKVGINAEPSAPPATR